MKRLLLFMLLITPMLLMLSVTSCTKIDIDNIDENIDYGTALAIPVGTVNMTLGDMLARLEIDELKTDSSNQGIILFIEEEPHYQSYEYAEGEFTAGEKVEDYFYLKNTDGIREVFEEIPSHITDLTLPEGKYPFQFDTLYHFGYNEHDINDRIIRVDSIIARSANIDMEMVVSGLEITPETPLDIIIEIPNITDNAHNSVQFRMTEQSQKFSKKIDHFTVAFFDDLNSVDMIYKFVYHHNGEKIIKRDAIIDYTTEFNIIDYDVLFGYFYDVDPITNDNISFDIPTDFFNISEFKDNRLLFHNPEIGFRIKSDIGIPVTLRVDSVFSTDANGQKHYAEFETGNYYEHDVAHALQVGEVIVEDIVFDRENGKTNKLFEAIPETFHYKWSVKVPYTDESNEYFVLHPINLWFEMYGKLPFSFDAGSHFSYLDTLDFNISNDGEETNSIIDGIDIEDLNLHLDIINSFPVNLTLSVTFIDGQQNRLTRDIDVVAANVDAEGFVTEPNIQNVVIEFDNDAKDILRTEQLEFNIRFATADELSRATLQTTNNLKIDVSAFAKAKTTINLSGTTNQN